MGELMQPGGVRCLQRMGLDECVEPARADSVVINGYVVIKVRPNERSLRRPFTPIAV